MTTGAVSFSRSQTVQPAASSMTSAPARTVTSSSRPAEMSALSRICSATSFAFSGAVSRVGEEALHDGVARIDLEVHAERRVGAVLVHGLHHAAHVRRHELVGVEREGGRIDEAVAGLHLGHAFAERLLEPLG
jgi:hypothetical protein